MKSIRQLTRQPLRTLAGILLTAIAVAVLCVSFSQTLAASDTARKLKETYITVALPTDLEVEIEGRNEWLETAAAQYPDIVTEDTMHGLASAYIPELAPCVKSPSYYGAMLEITLTEIGYVGLPYEDVTYPATEEMIEEYGVYFYTQREEIEGQGIYAELVGTVDRVIGLQGTHADPTGFTARLTLRLPDMQAFEDLDLTTGERYIVYGDSYTDLDKLLRANLAAFMTWYKEEDLPEWDMSTLEEYVDPDARSQEFYAARREGREPDYSGLPTSYKCKIGDLYHGLSAEEMKQFRSIGLTLEDRSVMPQYEAEERYTVPTIAPLSGTVEEFLASGDGTLWQERLDDIGVNTRSFPVMGVENLQYVAKFAAGRADIAEGRSFTAGEVKAGAKVCVISKYLAEENGLTLGDTIDISYFNYDFENPYQSFIHDGGTHRPHPYLYFSGTMDMLDREGYTIVGLYELENPWVIYGDDPYDFSPNTIFVPKTSVTGTMDFSTEGQFRTLVIASDRLADLLSILVEADMDGILEFYDNGYNAIALTLTDFEAAAKRILPIGIIVYAVVMLLFLFLFPAWEGRTLARMDSLGADHGKRVRHVLASTLGILIPGSVTGTLAAVALWQVVAEALGQYMETDIAVELNTGWLWLVMAVQAALVAAAAGGLGHYLSKNINPMNKR